MYVKIDKSYPAPGHAAQPMLHVAALFLSYAGAQHSGQQTSLHKWQSCLAKLLG